MPAHCTDLPSEEVTLSPLDKLDLAQMHLRRYCFLGSFDPVYSPKRSRSYKIYDKLNEYCQLIEPLLMFRILRVAYNAHQLPSRDEVTTVHAVYLLGDVPMNWKTALRSDFPKLVKTDSDLFLFCKYAALIHQEKKKPIFCKTIKKAITAWYTVQTPEALAHMFGANRGLHGFTHRALIRMCRITDGMMGTKYLYHSFNSTCTMITKDLNNPLPPLPEPNKKTTGKKGKKGGRAADSVKQGKAITEDTVQPSTSSSSNSQEAQTVTVPECDQEKIRSIVVGVSKLRTTTDAEEALKLVQQLDLKYEQLPYNVLQYQEVLKTIAQKISCTQLIKCLHSEKIRKHFSKRDVLKICRERFQKKGGMKNERVDPILFLMSMDRLSIVQPLKQTNNKNTSRGRLVQFSKQLYRSSFREMNPTNLRIHITVNMQLSYMKKILKNTKTVNYQFAASALAFSFYKVEKNCEVYRYTEAMHQLTHVKWNKKMDFVAAFEACSFIQNMKNNQRLCVPIMQAIEKKCVYDLFIVILPSATRGNKKHSSEVLANQLENYRKRHNEKAKFVIVDLLRFKKSMRYSQTNRENILEICGLDENTIPLIYNFALNQFD